MILGLVLILALVVPQQQQQQRRKQKLDFDRTDNRQQIPGRIFVSPPEYPVEGNHVDRFLLKNTRPAAVTDVDIRPVG
jgi:hypothetical protein